MNEIARTVLISVVSGLLAFGGAVLYLGGDDSEPSEPSLTRADVFAMIDDTPPALTLPSLTRADVQAMIDSQPPELTAGNPAYESIMAGVDLALSEVFKWPFDAFDAAAGFALCADNAGWDLLRDVWYLGVPDDRAGVNWQNATHKCKEDAIDWLYNNGE